MKKGTKLSKILLGLLLLVIGAVIGYGLGYAHYMSLAEAINVVDLATLVTTIFLAVYIPAVLDRRLQIKKDKKALIEERVEELQSLYRKINLLVQGENPISPKSYLSIKNTLDICQHKLGTIFTLVASSRLDISFAKEMEEIKSLCKRHKDLLWSPQMEELDFHYTDDVLEKEEQLYNQIDQVACLIIFKISEA